MRKCSFQLSAVSFQPVHGEVENLLLCLWLQRLIFGPGFEAPGRSDYAPPLRGSGYLGSISKGVALGYIPLSLRDGLQESILVTLHATQPGSVVSHVPKSGHGAPAVCAELQLGGNGLWYPTIRKEREGWGTRHGEEAHEGNRRSLVASLFRDDKPETGSR